MDCIIDNIILFIIYRSDDGSSNSSNFVVLKIFYDYQIHIYKEQKSDHQIFLRNNRTQLINELS